MISNEVARDRRQEAWPAEDSTLVLSPISDEDWPPSLSQMRHSFAGQLNVYRTMARHPTLLAAWAPLREHVVVKTALGKQLSEIVILRTGYRLGSTYEWAHHVVRGRACGISDIRLTSIRGQIEQMEADDGVVCAAVDELFDNHCLSPKRQMQISLLVGNDGLLDLIATVGFYTTLGFMLKSFNVPLEPEIVTAMTIQPLPTVEEHHGQATASTDDSGSATSPFPTLRQEGH